MTEPRSRYADWYVWAKRNLASDSAVCHAAAAAATDAELRGGSREQAITAARRSMMSGAHLAQPGPLELERRTYAEWFDWARRELGGVREQQHAAALAALDALNRGLGANAAVAAARQAAGIDAPPPPEPASAAPAPAPAPPPPPAYAPPSHSPAAYHPPPAFLGYAGFWRRLAAYLLDSLILFGAVLVTVIAAGVAYGVGLGIQGARTPNEDQLMTPLSIVFYGGLLLVSWLYSTLLESSHWQGTLGKLALGLRVTDAGGARIGWGRANVRFWVKLLLGTFCGLAYLTIPFTERKQGLHDLSASTLVVRTR